MNVCVYGLNAIHVSRVAWSNMGISLITNGMDNISMFYVLPAVSQIKYRRGFYCAHPCCRPIIQIFLKCRFLSFCTSTKNPSCCINSLLWLWKSYKNPHLIFMCRFSVPKFFENQMLFYIKFDLFLWRDPWGLAVVEFACCVRCVTRQ